MGSQDPKGIRVWLLGASDKNPCPFAAVLVLSARTKILVTCRLGPYLPPKDDQC